MDREFHLERRRAAPVKDPLGVIADSIAEMIREVAFPLITIDGPCASGKTTAAQNLAEELHGFVVHTDDFVIPHAQKTAERLAVPGGNCDAERLFREVIWPWKSGLPVQYRKYDCKADRLRDWEKADISNALILEGSYSNLPLIREYADVRIFVETPPEVRRKRLELRESPESLQRFLTRWIPLEDAYFSAYGLPDQGCIRVQGDPRAGSESADPDVSK